LGETTVSKLPTFLRNRVVIVDKNNKVRNKVAALTSGFFKEIDPIWEKMSTEKGIPPDSVNGHEHSICVLDESLTTLAVAVKYDC
jgi:hypothetical protein